MRQKIIFISWQPYCSRSDHIARELGGESYKIYYDFFGSRYSTVLFKYLAQTIKTLWILLKNRPKKVFVMSPPVFANIPVYIYSKIFAGQYVIDAHTGAFVDAYWQRVQKLQHFFARKAKLVSVTNKKLKDIVDALGAKSIIIPDVPVLHPNLESVDLQGSKNIVLINTFAKDEPLENFLEATRNHPEIMFYITGKLSENGKYNRLNLDNVMFTGFLPDNQYYGLLASADAVAVLTTRDNTMQRGAYEAIYAETPVITSNWDVLRVNFPKGTVFVDNTVEGISQGINKMIDSLDKLKKEASQLKTEKMKNWEKIKKSLLDSI